MNAPTGLPEALACRNIRAEGRAPLDTAGTILALDLGTSTGWALRRTDSVIASGTASFKPGRYEGAGMRFLRFAQWLDSLDPPEAVYFEEVRRHRGPRSPRHRSSGAGNGPKPKAPG